MQRCNPTRLAVVLAFAGFFLLPACGPRYYAASSRSETLLRVANRGADDVRVFLLRGAAPITVGTVPAQSSRLFTLSPAVLGSGSDVRLRAEAVLARHAVESVVFSLASGGTVAWEVEASLGITSFMLH
jgi:hypothetical protein